MKRTDLNFIFIASWSFVSCSFNFELTSTRTALENQIMGSYKELDDELIVTNADRNLVAKTGDKKDGQDLSSARAMRNRAFNADDIDELKDEGILGEQSDAKLVILPKDFKTVSKASPEQMKLAEALVDEENRDRNALIAAEVAKMPSSEAKDVQTVREKFAKDILDSAPKGHWFNSGQKWQQKF